MCGIFGAVGKGEVLEEILGGMRLLQHRGQDAAGILTLDSRRGQNHQVKSPGPFPVLVHSKQEELLQMKGNMGCGWLRYQTTGVEERESTVLRDVQPFWTEECRAGLVHNGQVRNMLQLEAILHDEGKRLNTESDGELILRTFARHFTEDPFEAVERTQKEVVGGYSVIMPIYGHGLLAFRDPNGIRPLCMGRKEDVMAFASESNTLEMNGYTDIEDLEHGEAVLIREDMSIDRKVLHQKERRNCAFEYIYFGHSSSLMEGTRINAVRYNMGKRMAQRLPEGIDIIVPVPESGRPFAAGLHEASGIPLKDVLEKYTRFGRIFIIRGQGERESLTGKAYSLIDEAVEDRSVLLVDDSVVRGTTMRWLVGLLKDSGAREVHVASEWPIYTNSCPYGIYTPDKLLGRDDAIGQNRTIDQIRQYIGSKTLTYGTKQEIIDSIGHSELCFRCIGDKLVTPEVSLEI